MGREAMIKADMEAVGTYSPIFDKAIHELAKQERELSRAEKAWKAAGGKMVAELVNKTGATYTAKDPNYAVVDQLRKDILAQRAQLGLTPKSLKAMKAKLANPEVERRSKLEELIDAAKEYAAENAGRYQADVDGYVEKCARPGKPKMGIPQRAGL